ncbi:amidohydrolase family protein [Salinibacterium sp. TMP30]|uniref:amidohydrolase family protein n=1 Tax=Salinibacterium sp. TMP30 TaxID=3138237 RepID=UPI0031389C45
MLKHQIIDTHVHFWDMANPDTGMKWVWLEKDFVHPILGDIDAMKSLKYGINNVFAESRFANVRAFVHVQAALGSTDPVLETRWLTRMRNDSPVPFTIVAHADLSSTEAIRQLDEHGESPYFVGVRDFASEGILASGEINSRFESSLTTLAARGLVLDLDCEWMNMGKALELAHRHPDLQIVLEHIGFPRRRDDEYFEMWKSGITKLAGAENVTCKISGLGMIDPLFTAESVRRWFDTSLEAFGTDRCVIGSNWPLDRLFSSYDVIMNLYRSFLGSLSDSEQAKVLSENAAQVFKL